MKISQIKDVRVRWIDEGGSYAYVALPESIAANDDLETIRFVLKEINGDDSNLEVVIQRKDDASHFKTDYYNDPTEELPLKEFDSPDELLFVYDGNHGVAYFHLST